ncbi:LPS export ABC transporter ATP-binding protein [Lamprobacter modestohalophilus]|uniref:Lipopolysaccharide export system ATP-binding protein LptB n=1 Tax=Lamprobacter modestohalophilus TaxID=1064514 RepID=A0A9X1B3K4_9GAMM|nr:LPS export ABC transporter ATP-binding protein [Lamprobacter modestohalophilus]MCF7979494.1 LPS export ABC transporter ATP-binding protein [Chromatiaceae bacterium]MBK1617687.1 LPS export ABC transporter ATP-binding protein [Lamprobacter modestohalophilus]MCF7994222.1 LPS export ABC transporter ATP-binding protein [Chromatiaceae bacterium]MCF8003183.1 LPS export ABC transporter ATP-binding protein [Chromatiaceae bacterium]MCF8016188.1 LPS export ABC transporter ATP-binding protein [Chromati
MATLEARALAKTYRRRRVVDGVDLAVNAGEVVGLLGPNGAGKTTSFYMIVGLVGANAGRITLDGEDITHRPMHARARSGLSYLAQEPSVFRKLTARDNLTAVLEMRNGTSREDRRQRCDELLDELGIGHVADSLALSLSGGERRRLEIARALAVEPKVMLLDEPFAGVDPIAVGDIKGIISHLRDRQIGVLITDHNVRETLDICDRAYIINAGRVIASGAPAELLQDPQVRAVYLGEHFRL